MDRLVPAVFVMASSQDKVRIEPGMKVSVRKSARDRIGVVTRVEGDYVIVHWISADLRDDGSEYCARREEVTPLAGWL
jgi:hypothetical protein